MKDFFKIFFGLCFLTGAFLAGRNYGEKTFFETERYKQLSGAGEELELVRGELENTKTKLQNILDRSPNQKTDEMLANLMQVFLADLGLQIKNKEAILAQAKSCENAKQPIACLEKPTEPVKPKVDVVNKAIEKLTREEQKLEKQMGKIKAGEWFVENSKSPEDVMKNLDKVTLTKLVTGQLDEIIEKIQCERYVGDYRGMVKANITNTMFGSFKFMLKEKKIAEGSVYKGNMEWNNDQSSPITGGISNGCGHKLHGLNGRIFYLESNKYIQLYGTGNPGQLAGNLYETLPNMTSNRVGKFILNRTDKF